MRRYVIPVVFLVSASCAATVNESALDRHVTRVEGTAAVPSDPRVDAPLPGPEWYLQRDVPVDDGLPTAQMLFLQPEPDVKATIYVVLFPSSDGSPQEMARNQRLGFIQNGMPCSKLTVSEDGKYASFTLEMMDKDSAIFRVGKVSFLLRGERKDWTLAVFGSWEPEADKAMKDDMAKVEAGATIK